MPALPKVVAARGPFVNFRPKTVKPPFGAAQIDWGHPLASNLAFAVILNEGVGTILFDLHGTRPRFQTGTPTWVVGDRGIMIRNPTSEFRELSAHVPTQYGFSLHALTRANSGNNGTLRACVAVLDAALAGQALGWGSTTGIPTLRDQGTIVAGTAIGLNVWASLTGNFESSTSRRIYVNGILNVSNSTSTTFGAKDRFAVGDETSIYDLLLALCYTRLLSPAEMLWLHTEPYAFLQPVPAVTYAFMRTPAAPAAGVTPLRTLMGVGR